MRDMQKDLETFQSYLDAEEKGSLPHQGEDPEFDSVFLQSALRSIESCEKQLGITEGWNAREEQGGLHA